MLYVYEGDVSFSLIPFSVVKQEWEIVGSVSFLLTPSSSIITDWVYITPVSVELISTSSIIFDGKISYLLKAICYIDGVSYSDSLIGTINISLEEDSAAFFSFALSSNDNPKDWLDKEVKLSYQAADETGLIIATAEILIGKIRDVFLDVDGGITELSGYDYGGVHNNLGELYSGEINTILTGEIYIDSAGVHNTGFAPIWDVSYTGIDEGVEDGTDYFVDTLNGKIYIPYGSRLINEPAILEFKYAEYFTDVEEFIETAAALKGWEVEYDGITIPDYSTPENQPIVTLSNESIIDFLKVLSEIGGGKLDTSLYPTLRIYSETNNLGNNALITFTEEDIFENTLAFSATRENLLNEQTVKSAIRTFTNVEIGGLLEKASSSGTVNGNAQYYSTIHSSILPEIRSMVMEQINAPTYEVIAEETFDLDDVYQFEIESTWVGDTYADYVILNTITPELRISYTIDNATRTITYKVERPIYYASVSYSSGGYWGTYFLSFTPAGEWTLTFKTKDLSYGDEVTTQQVEGTGTQTIPGVDEALVGDVYEHPYIETEEQADALCTAILTSRKLAYGITCQFPLNKFGEWKIGDKIKIQSKSKEFTGLLKTIGYAIDTDSGEGTVSIIARGKRLL